MKTELTTRHSESSAEVLRTGAHSAASRRKRVATHDGRPAVIDESLFRAVLTKETERAYRVAEPVVLVLHVGCPRVTYTDRGKSAVVVS